MDKSAKKLSSRILDWPENERPRERLIKKGAESISSAELVAILLGQGSSQYNAVDLARHLIGQFGTLDGLAMASLTELQQVKGIGPAKAVTLLAAFQLYRNLQSERAEKQIITFKDPAAVAEIYKPLLGHLKKESFYVILLDNAMRRIADFEISKGLLNASLVHPREVFNPAIKHSSKGVILIHNHPSGVLEPSAEDISITKKLLESGKILEIPVFDHLIITDAGYFSFKENDLI
jgi:DNA repair protein RadC